MQRQSFHDIICLLHCEIRSHLVIWDACSYLSPVKTFIQVGPSVWLWTAKCMRWSDRISNASSVHNGGVHTCTELSTCYQITWFQVWTASLSQSAPLGICPAAMIQTRASAATATTPWSQPAQIYYILSQCSAASLYWIKREFKPSKLFQKINSHCDLSGALYLHSLT